MGSDREHLLSHLDNSSLALIEWDSEFHVVRWSKRATQMFGWTEAEMLGKKPTDWNFVFEDDVQQVNEVMQHLLSQNQTYNTSANRNYTRDGRVLDCVWHNSLKVGDDGQTKSILSFVSDESEIHRLAIHLAFERERLELALSATRLGVCDLDLESGALVCTPETEAIFGGRIATIEELNQRFHPDDLAPFWEAVDQAVASGNSFDVQYRVIAPDKTVRWIEGHGKAIRLEGRTRRIAATVLDITDRKHAEDELLRAKQMAESASVTKSAFLANMSHEIRTPLGVILGFAEILADPDLLKSERDEALAAIRRNGSHLSRLIGDILDLSKVEAGKLEVQRQPLPLRTVLHQAIDCHREKAESKGVKLTTDIEENLPETIDSDEDRLRQILGNLIGNAIKFTDQGSVHLSAKTETKPGGERALRISVEDTGVGISQEGRELLFQPFTQVDRAQTRRFGGTGLGLALSRRLARSLGGDVELAHATEHEHGSRFDLTLALGGSRPNANVPLYQSNQFEIDHLDLHPSHQRLGGLKVLVAEDSVDTRALMARLLSRHGAIAHFAQDGEQAVDLALQAKWDVILMDIQMPGLDGYEVTKRLRANECTTPIIALTAHAMKEERDRCISAGCDEHLTKPVNAVQLVQLIRSLLHDS